MPAKASPPSPRAASRTGPPECGEGLTVLPPLSQFIADSPSSWWAGSAPAPALASKQAVLLDVPDLLVSGVRFCLERERFVQACRSRNCEKIVGRGADPVTPPPVQTRGELVMFRCLLAAFGPGGEAAGDAGRAWVDSRRAPGRAGCAGCISLN